MNYLLATISINHDFLKSTTFLIAIGILVFGIILVLIGKKLGKINRSSDPGVYIYKKLNHTLLLGYGIVFIVILFIVIEDLLVKWKRIH